jgi:hypothetical protein
MEREYTRARASEGEGEEEGASERKGERVMGGQRERERRQAPRQLAMAAIRNAIVEGADAQTLRRLVTPERLEGNNEAFVHLNCV